MGLSRALVLIAVITGTLAAPQKSSGSLPKCSLECATDISEKEFAPYTLVYDYEGVSKIVGKRTKESEVQLKMNAEVHLTMYGPCDGLIQVKNPKFEEHVDDIMTELLTERPMMFAMSNHVITRVCAHPEDEPTSLNFKKGLLSSIQNTLPHFSPSFSDKNFEEIDILGKCLTRYQISEDRNSYLVKKFKDHKSCTQVENQSQNILFLLRKTLFSMVESNSTCIQTFDKSKGNIKSVECTDINYSPMFGGYVSAIQTSKLYYVKDKETILPDFPIYRPTNIEFEEIPQSRKEEFVPIVEELLKELCVEIQDSPKEDSARIFAKIIEFIHRVPEKSVSELLANIRSGKYCSEKKKLESLYLDAIAVVNNGGAVKVMVDEIVNKRPGVGRKLLYSLSLHMMMKPCIHSIQNLKPLFEMEDVPTSILLSAGTLIRRYCSDKPECELHQPIKEIIDLVKQKMSSCSSPDPLRIHRNLLLLKTLGNMGVMNQALAESLVKCLETEEAPTNIRIGVTQAFRHTSCWKQPTKRLIKATIGETVQDQEVRIGAYVAAIRCADLPQTRRILEEIVKDPTTQVRSYVLSHMRNLQATSAPWLQSQSYNLSSLIIPIDYGQDVRLHSQNIDFSYYFPSLGIGAGMDIDVVYKDSYIPRMLKSNISVNVLNNVLNIGEFGIHIEDLEALVKMVFGSEGYLQGSSFEKLLKDILRVVEEIMQKAKEHFKGNEELNQIDMSTFPKILEMLNSPENKKFKMDLFARLFGQEVMFFSPQVNNKKDITMVIENVLSVAAGVLLKLIHQQDINMEGLHYSAVLFLPTAQGIPLQFKLATTFVSQMKQETDLSLADSLIKLDLSGAAHLNGFMGYSLGAKAGMRLNYTHIFNSKFKFKSSLENKDYSIEADIPEEGVIAETKGETYVFTKWPGKGDVIVQPTNDDYAKSHLSLKASDVIGLDVHLESTFVDFFNSPYFFPLGKSQMKIEWKKVLPKNPLMELRGTMNNEPSLKSLSMTVKTSGREEPLIDKILLEKSVKRDSKSTSMLVVLEWRDKIRSVRVDLTPTPANHGKGYEMTVYSSKQKQISTKNMILDLKVAGRRHRNSLEGLFEFKTLNELEPYIKSNIELDVEVEMKDMKKMIPKSILIRKCEVAMLLLQKYETMNYIREQSYIQGSSYKFASVTLKKPKGKLLSVTGDFHANGTLSKQNFESSLNVKVDTRRRSLYSQVILSLNKMKKELELKIKKDNEGLFDINLLLENRSPEIYVAKATIDIPKSEMKYLMIGKIKNRQNDHYDLDISALRNQEPIIQLKGPFELRKMEKLFKQKMDITLKYLKSEKEYSIVSNVLWSPEKNATLFSIKTPEGPIIRVELALRMEEGRHDTQLALHIPKYLDSETKIEYAPYSKISFKENLLLSPLSERPRKVKMASSLDLEANIFEATLLTDTDRNKVSRNSIDSIEAASIYEEKVDIKESAYKYHLKLELAPLIKKSDSPISMTFSAVMPTNEELKIYTTLLKSSSVQGNMLVQNLDWHLNVDPISGKNYIISVAAQRKYQPTPLISSWKTNALLETPAIHSKLDIYLHREKEQFNILGKLDARGECLEEPLVTKIEYSSSLQDYSGSTDLIIGSNQIWQGMIKRGPHENKIMLKLSPTNQREYVLSVERTSVNLIDASLERSGEKVLECKFELFPKDWSIFLTIPSRSLEAHSRISPRDFSMELFTNRKQSEDKYAITGSYSHELSRPQGNQLEGKIRMSHPHSIKDKIIEAKFISGEVDFKGLLIIDIFEDPSKKVEAEVNLQKLAEGKYDAVMQLGQKGSKSKVAVAYTLTDATKELMLKIWPKQSSEAKLSLLLSHVRTTAKSGTMYAMLKAPSHSLEFVGEHRSEGMTSCMGTFLNGTLISERYGSYDIASAVSPPGYFEIGGRESSQDSMYFAKLGMMNPASFKVEVSEVIDNTSAALSKGLCLSELEDVYSLYGGGSWKLTKNLALIGAELRSPLVISLDMGMDVAQIKKLRERMISSKHRAVKICEEAIVDIPKALMKDMLPESFDLSPKLHNLKEEALSKLKLLNLSEFDILEKVIKFLKLVEEKYSEFYKLLKNFENKLEHMLPKMLRNLIEKAKDKLKKLEVDIKGVISKIEREIEKIFKDPKMKKNSSYFGWINRAFEGTSIWDRLEKLLREMKEKFSKEYHEVLKYLNNIRHKIAGDLKELLKKLEHFHPISRIIHWIEKWLHSGDDHPKYIYELLARKLSGIHITKDNFMVTLKVPLKTPAYSLQAAVPSIGLPLYMGKLRSSSRGYMVPLLYPYYKTAKITEYKVVTFDGVVMPFIFSKCQIVLCRFKGYQILLTKPNEKRSQLLLENNQGEGISITMEEGQDIKVPIVGGRERFEKGSLKVHKVSEKQVTIDTNPFHLVVKDGVISIEAKPSAYNQVRGLLGSLDNEVSNYPKSSRVEYKPNSPHGIHHLASASARNVFNHNKKQKSCFIP